MKKQIFTIILFTVVSLSVLGQFKFDGGTNSLRLQTGGVDRLFIHPTNGNVGVATNSPNAKLDLNGDLALTKKLDYTTTGVQNALDRQGASRIYINASGTVTLNGIAGGQDGLVIFLYTAAGATLIINNESLLALSGNRIATHTGATVTITARGGVSMIYDSSVSTWRIFGFADENSTWNSKGNAGTNPFANFIGTTDNQGVVLKTNNVERMNISNIGNIGIGVTPDANAKFIVSRGVSGVAPGSNASAVIEDNTSHYLGIYSPDVNETGVLFGKPTLGRASGGVIYTSGNDLNLRTGGNNTRVIIASNGNVGIGSTTPTAKLDVDGDIVVRKTTLNTAGVQNALNRGGGSLIYFNAIGTITLNGIAGGQDGMILYLFTGFNTTLLINNENANAIAGNRIGTNTSAAITISGRGGATLIYDSATSLWRVIGVAN